MSIPIFFAIPKTRKGLKITMIIFAVICIGLSVFAFISWSNEKQDIAESGQPDFNTLAQNELTDDMYVTGAIDLAIDYYAEDYETNSSGKRASDDSEALYYLVPVYESSADGTVNIRYFITYKAEPKDFDTMDAILTQTRSNDPMTAMLTLDYAQVDDLPESYQQYLSEYINSKDFYENGSFVDWCVEYNILGTTNRTEIASRIVPYMIRKTAGPDSPLTAGIVLAGLAVVFIIIFLVLHLVKGPIQGVIDEPKPDDFSKLREMETEISAEGTDQNGFDPRF